MRAQVGSLSLPCASPLCCLLSGHFPLAHTGPLCLPLGECRQATILPDSQLRGTLTRKALASQVSETRKTLA